MSKAHLVHGTELIVYVDSNGAPTGETAPKLEAHNAHTRLHSAFSCYIFNDQNKLLVTQRALAKKVWPGVWTNSVCGHPLPDESRTDALRRRAEYELGVRVEDVELILPMYTYKTPPYRGIIEHEFCPVYVAHIASELVPNPEEVEDYQWLNWDEFVRQARADNDDTWSWWCKDQIPKLASNDKFKTFISLS